MHQRHQDAKSNMNSEQQEGSGGCSGDWRDHLLIEDEPSTSVVFHKSKADAVPTHVTARLQDLRESSRQPANYAARPNHRGEVKWK